MTQTMTVETATISSLTLNAKLPAVRLVLRDAHRAHCAVHAATDGHDMPTGRVLWALHNNNLIISSSRPVTAHCFPAGFVSAASSHALPHLDVGQRIRWAATVAPVRNTLVGRTKPKKVLVDDPIGWIRKRLQGLAPAEVGGQKISSIHGDKKQTRDRITYYRWLMHGTGTIVDPDAWNVHTMSGVGPGKAFGLGLVLWGRA